MISFVECFREVQNVNVNLSSASIGKTRSARIHQWDKQPEGMM